MKTRYFETESLIKKYPKARYYYILGGRSAGKTFPTIRKAIKEAIEGKGDFAYVRRYKEDLKSAHLEQLFNVHSDFVNKLTKGDWNRVVYWRSRVWLEKWDIDENGLPAKIARKQEPLGIICCLNTWEHEKGADFGFDRGIKNIIFDEALTKGGKYLPDEWSIFQNVISTLVRDRWDFDTKIFLLANPLSKWSSPYTRNMGITKKMYERPGITEIKYPDEKGEVAMSAVFAYIGELSEVAENANKVHNTFFAFTHSKGKAKAITHGFWEMDDSARLPGGVYTNSEKLRTIYAIFEEEKLGIDIMRYEETGKYYLMIYPVTDIRKNTYFMILSPCLDKYAIVGSDDDHPITQLLFTLQSTGLVYYSDDSTADAWHGFLMERHKYKI